MPRLTWLASTAVLAAMLVTTSARATPGQSGVTANSQDPPLEWRWQRFRAWEYPLTAAALGTAMYLRFGAASPSANWTGGVLVDDWGQEHLSIRSVPQRNRVARVTDVFFYGAMGYRFVDSLLVPLLVWRSPDAALQLSMIDLESFAFVAITLWGSQAVFGRERPYAERCSDPAFARTEPGCAPGGAEHNRSFYAGHPAVVLTAAGLTCTHHAHLPLYGGGAAETLSCGAMIGAAAATGAGRILSEEHHLSDVVVGYGIGAVAGWLMPELLHYRHGAPRRPAEERQTGALTVRAMLVPLIDQHALGLDAIGVF